MANDKHTNGTPRGGLPGKVPGSQGSGGQAAGEGRQLTLVKKGHYYLFRYNPGDEGTLLQTLIEKAEDPKCPLDWFDAAVLSHQMGHRMADEMQALIKTKLATPGGYRKAADSR